jgi:hypothetical protein
MTTQPKSSSGTHRPPGTKAGAGATALKAKLPKRRSIKLPFIGEQALADLAFTAGMGVLVVAEIVELPIALIVVTGKWLADQHHNRLLAALGTSMEDAG